MKALRLGAVVAVLLTIGLPAWASSLNGSTVFAPGSDNATPALSGFSGWAMTPIDSGRGLEILGISVLVVIAASRLRFKKNA